jgi:mannose-1-phosphate guanylyltransferase
LRGDCLPKQYVNFLGDHSLLEATFNRARTIVPFRRQFVVVTENHFDYPEVAQQLANYPDVHVAVQPINRDTGLGLLLPLAQLYRARPDSTVVIFPSDHFIEEERLFISHVDAAFALVERDSEKTVLLAIAPTHAETDYGYILPSHCEHETLPFGAREVKHFIEKPNPTVARTLIKSGGIWNTMVMVFNLRTLLEHVRAIKPLVYRTFQEICDAVDSSRFSSVVKRVFETSYPLNLSKGILENIPSHKPHSLLVLPVRGVQWSDWGSAERILATSGHTRNGRCCVESPSHDFHTKQQRDETIDEREGDQRANQVP